MVNLIRQSASRPHSQRVIRHNNRRTFTMLADGTAGTPYSETLRANVQGVRWRVSNGTLPDGLQLSSTSGIISGTPRTAGTSTIEITAEYNGETVRTTFTLVVNASGALAITTSSLPNATVNTELAAVIFTAIHKK